MVWLVIKLAGVNYRITAPRRQAQKEVRSSELMGFTTDLGANNGIGKDPTAQGKSTRNSGSHCTTQRETEEEGGTQGGTKPLLMLGIVFFFISSICIFRSYSEFPSCANSVQDTHIP